MSAPGIDPKPPTTAPAIALMPNIDISVSICVIGATPVFFVYALALSPTLALIMASATVVGVALATRMILRVRSLEARFTQTFQTLLCTSAVLTALMAIPFSQVAPQLVELASDPEAMAVSLLGLLRGIALQLISTPAPTRVKAIIDEAERATRRALKP